jgi:hypothetical protein
VAVIRQNQMRTSTFHHTVVAPARSRTPRRWYEQHPPLPLPDSSASQQDSSHWLATFQIDNPHSAGSKVTRYASVHIGIRGDRPSLRIKIFHAK